jgi:hypothetical protein
MSMQTLESDSTAVACVVADSAAPNANCGAVCFNATQRHILSRLAVTAHDDSAAFADLLAALLDEHQPAGMTKRHLIEELATIIWRKRRVLLAQGAKINEGLKSTLSSPKSMMPSAAPFQRGLSGENTDLRDLLDATPEQIAITIPLDGLSSGQRTAHIFVRAWRLVFAEGIPPHAVHKAFSRLPEYRGALTGYPLAALRMKAPEVRL